MTAIIPCYVLTSIYQRSFLLKKYRFEYRPYVSVSLGGAK